MKNIDEILKQHKLWVESQGADGKRANLRWADLSEADLSEADLRWADLSEADLSEADLRGADIDFSCLPLWCGSLNFKIDERQAAQIKYHLKSLCNYSGIDIDGVDVNKWDWVESGELSKI